ncbi:MAG TPA: hypothetical protein VFD60_07410 [Nitrososphaeraceae archaeon]|nr:hypothetical protein [Nitrososphaeraceae archaeon]
MIGFDWNSARIFQELIEGKTNKVVATISVGHVPNGVASDEIYGKI